MGCRLKSYKVLGGRLHVRPREKRFVCEALAVDIGRKGAAIWDLPTVH